MSSVELTSARFAVAEKLKQEGKQEILQNEVMEEMEDEEGNVYNRKVSLACLLSRRAPMLTIDASADVRGSEAARTALNATRCVSS